MAIGRNKLDAVVFNQTISGITDHALIAYNNVSADSNYLSHEAELQSGDSGAPMMVEVAGSLTLVGINWFIGTDSNDASLNGFSYVGNYSGVMNAFISANPIPELSASGLYMALFLITLAVSSRRIRHRSNESLS